MPPLDAPTTQPLSPYWTSPGGEIRLFQGDVIDVLRKLPAQSVHCVITSVPYWGLRSYDVTEGFRNEVDARKWSAETTASWNVKDRGTSARHIDRGASWSEQQKKWIGAIRTETLLCGKEWGQIGSEPQHDCGTMGKAQCGRCFVCVMVWVFAEVHRVLHDSGTLFLNLGDTYANIGTCGGASPVGDRNQRQKDRDRQGSMKRTREGTYGGLKPGNLCGIPWRVSLALQEWGWILRSDIPWIKRSPMPESVTNRPAKALEYVFMFAKQSGYYCDMEAVRRPQKESSQSRYDYSFGGPKSLALIEANKTGIGQRTRVAGEREYHESGRNFRQADLWFDSIKSPYGLCGIGDELVGLDVTSQAYKGAHFATFGVKLVEPLIKMGTSAKGCCAKCGEAWRRVSERVKEKSDRSARGKALTSPRQDGNSWNENDGKGFCETKVKTLGWQPRCSCNAAVVPCVLLDPFCGTMTVGCTGVIHGRHSIGIDLSEKYLRENAIPRCQQFLKQVERNKKEILRLSGGRKVDLFGD